MTNKSLKKIKDAIDRWRQTKRYRTEPMPRELVRRAKSLVAQYGITEVARVTGIGYEQLGRKYVKEARAKAKETLEVKGAVNEQSRSGRARHFQQPSFSRVEIQAAPQGPNPLLEAETSNGLKLRLFSFTPETVDLLRSLSGSGGER